MRWPKFIFLDLLGALISGPTSIFVGMWATEKLVQGDGEDKSKEAALEKAIELFKEYDHIVLLVIAGLVTIVVAYAIYKIRRYRKEIKRALEEKKEAAETEKTAAPAEGAAEPPVENGGESDA
jgi:membrane protein DedA with SNARE-associated domain